ncbi:MAG: DUF192 domain-containing protein [Nanoarchaeota archaeon]|nr:DUF192 domain-containing protein [Nanoarchaeota archaeon]
MKKISFNHKGKKISLNCRECGFFSLGLMFRSKWTMSCVFEFEEITNFKISSIFVFFPFVAIWLDSDGKVMEIKKIEPFTLLTFPKKSYRTLVEVPINEGNSEIVRSLVGD